MAQAIQFLFIVVVPLVLVGGAVATLFAAGALFNVLEHPDELRRRIENAFRRPPKPAKTPGPDHYYRPHWTGDDPPEQPTPRS